MRLSPRHHSLKSPDSGNAIKSGKEYEEHLHGSLAPVAMSAVARV